jgi:hypothetical protein
MPYPQYGDGSLPELEGMTFGELHRWWQAAIGTVDPKRDPEGKARRVIDASPYPAVKRLIEAGSEVFGAVSYARTLQRAGESDTVPDRQPIGSKGGPE